MMNTDSNTQGLLLILRKRWRIILLISGSIFGAFALFTMAATPIYEGKTQIIIERLEIDNLTGANRVQSREPEFEKTQFQLIRSHAVARRVVSLIGLDTAKKALDDSSDSTFLSRLRSTIGAWVRSVKSIFGSSTGDMETPVDQGAWSEIDLVALKLSRDVRVRPVQGSNITDISYYSPLPEFATLVANTYVNAYLEETLDMKMDATRRNLAWMTEKADSERLKLQAIEKKLQDYMEANNLITLENRVTIIPEALAQLGRDLVMAQSRTKEIKLLYDKVRGVSGDLDAAENVLSVSEGSSLDVLRAQILRAEQNNMELAGKYGSMHPVMLKANADLNILQEKRKQEIRRIIQKVKNQHELALSNENSLRAQLNSTKAEALGLNEKYVQYSVLKREIDTNRQLYDALLTKIKSQSITGETRPVNIWVVEQAKRPINPVRPMVALNLLLGLVIGLCSGLGSALVINYLDNRIKSVEGIEEVTGVPPLGSVTFNRDKDAMNEIARTAPRSEYAESYNALRTALLLSAAESPPRKILVTSSIAGEGKTTTAVNLALTMAKAGSRVLLIDGDLRKPALHKIFNLSNRVGLSSYLSGGTGKSMLCKSTHENLAILLAGPTPPNPYELLNSTRLAQLLDNLMQEFDVIICDTPPTLTVADSRAISRFFDGMILVTRAGLSTFPMIRRTVRMLNDVNAKILGILVNGVQARDQEYHRYYSSYIEETEKAKKIDVKGMPLGTVLNRDS